MLQHRAATAKSHGAATFEIPDHLGPERYVQPNYVAMLHFMLNGPNEFANQHFIPAALNALTVDKEEMLVGLRETVKMANAPGLEYPEGSEMWTLRNLELAIDKALKAANAPSLKDMAPCSVGRL